MPAIGTKFPIHTPYEFRFADSCDEHHNALWKILKRTFQATPIAAPRFAGQFG
jgi:hypothetical protein